MHDTGHTSTHDLSLTSMHGWVMTYGTRLLTPYVQGYSRPSGRAPPISVRNAEHSSNHEAGSSSFIIVLSEDWSRLRGPLTSAAAAGSIGHAWERFQF